MDWASCAAVTRTEEQKTRQVMKHTFLCGTYTEKGSEGIYRFTFEDGNVAKADLFCKIADPKYISVQNGLVASAASFEDGCGIAVIDKNGDKAIDRAEWDAFVKNHSAGTMGHGNMGGMPAGGGKPAPKCDAMPLVTPPDGK